MKRDCPNCKKTVEFFTPKWDVITCCSKCLFSFNSLTGEDNLKGLENNQLLYFA